MASAFMALAVNDIRNPPESRRAFKWRDLLRAPLAPLSVDRDGTMARCINEFWEGNPDERKAISTTGRAHLAGITEHLTSFGWQEVEEVRDLPAPVYS